MSLYAREIFVDRSKGYACGDSGIYQTCFDKTGDLFRYCRKQYGRPRSKIYIDRKDGSFNAIGWVFEKRVKYSDCLETFLQETWVEVHTAPPDKTITYHYAEV